MLQQVRQVNSSKDQVVIAVAIIMAELVLHVMDAALAHALVAGTAVVVGVPAILQTGNLAESVRELTVHTI